MNRTKKLDMEIKKRVQRAEEEIPAALEKKFLEEIRRIQPLPARPKPKTVYLYGALTAAAAILVAAFLFLFLPLYKSPPQSSENQVMIWSARLEGKPADTYIVNIKDPDMTIAWVEKKPTEEVNNENYF